MPLAHSAFTILAVVAALIAVNPAAGAPPREVAPRLLAAAEGPVLGIISWDPSVLRSRPVVVDFDLLAGIQPGGRASLDLFDGVTVVVIFERATVRPPHTTWFGSVEDEPAARFALVVGREVIAAIVHVPSLGTYRIRTQGEGQVVTEIDEGAFPPCGPEPARARAAPGGGPEGGGAGGGGVSCDEGSVIDVLVVYTQVARSAAGGTGAIEAEIGLAVALTNNSYDNSLVDTQLNVVHVAEVDYNESGSYSQHLNRLTSTNDGFMDNVHALRDQYGADMVALLVDDGQFCGIAWLMQNLSPGFEASAFSVTSWFCAAGNLTFAHELGHNMGCAHDRANAGGAVFSYAYGFQQLAGPFRTVMAYNCPGGCPRVQHFSNPDVLYLNLPTGVDIEQPDSAHNALTINQTAFTVSNFRPSAPATDDGFEENDSCAAAASLPSGAWSSLLVTSTDEDWYLVPLSTLANLTVDVTFIDLVGDIDLELYDACGGTVKASATTNTSNETLSYTNFGPNGDFYLRVFLVEDGCNQYDLTTSVTVLHDLCSGAPLQFAGSTTFSNVGATTDGPSEAAGCNFNGDSQIQSDVWYRYPALCDGIATVSLCGSTYDTKLAVYREDCPAGPGTVIVCNRNFCGQQSEVSFAVTSGTKYRIRIGGHQGAQGSGTLTITCVPDVLPCPEDVNGDGDINVLDLIDLLLCFGLPAVPGCEDEDVNGDGNVNVLDLIDLLLLFGTPCP